MSKRGWRQVGAASGFVFVALYVFALAVLQDLDFPAAGTASPEDIRGFAETERQRTALATISYMAAWTAFLWFIASMRSSADVPEAIRRLEWTGAGAGLLTAGLSLGAAGLEAEVILHDLATTDDTTVLSQWAIYDAAAGIAGVTPILRAAFVGAFSAVILRAHTLPRWVGWFGLLVAAINLVGAIDFAVPATWSLTGHPLLDLMAFLAWVLIASAALLMNRHRVGPEADAPDVG